MKLLLGFLIVGSILVLLALIGFYSEEEFIIICDGSGCIDTTIELPNLECPYSEVQGIKVFFCEAPEDAIRIRGLYRE